MLARLWRLHRQQVTLPLTAGMWLPRATRHAPAPRMQAALQPQGLLQAALKMQQLQVQAVPESPARHHPHSLQLRQEGLHGGTSRGKPTDSRSLLS